MDRLDDVLATAVPLLKRVDEVLSTTGAPADHQVWPSLRRVRLLPWDAVQAVAALRPGDLAEAEPELRADARSYATVAESLPPPGAWSGDAADAYDDARRHTAEQLSGRPDSLDERLEATADLAAALTDWMRETRRNLAVTLAEVLTSAQALALSAPLSSPTSGSASMHPSLATPGAASASEPLSAQAAAGPAATRDASAAADVAARVLETVADSYDAALDLISGSADLTTAHRP